jgi:hypothetical protein
MEEWVGMEGKEGLPKPLQNAVRFSIPALRLCIYIMNASAATTRQGVKLAANTTLRRRSHTLLALPSLPHNLPPHRFHVPDSRFRTHTQHPGAIKLAKCQRERRLRGGPVEGVARHCGGEAADVYAQGEDAGGLEDGEGEGEDE